MSIRDEGKTHFYGDGCPGGHGAAGLAGVDLDDQLTPDEANTLDAAARRQVEEDGCPFCAIIAGDAPATVVRRWPDAIAIVPLNPIVTGHLLVIPTKHVRDVAENRSVTASTAARVAELVWGSCNVITSRGQAATQSVFHLHWHIVPRSENDGVALPWYSGRSKRRGGRG